MKWTKTSDALPPEGLEVWVKICFEGGYACRVVRHIRDGIFDWGSDEGYQPLEWSVIEL